ncbi:MAG: Holliday junction resolvase RuvX [Bacillota bacterium]|nr:Holliday junction resolvase RuvX [Bacillota bacterium]
MRILALDVGTKNVGVAISDPLGITAQSLPTIRRKGKTEQEIEGLATIVKEKVVDTIVVGYPRNMNGTEGPSCEMAKEYGELLGNKVKMPIVYWDERLTSKMAESAMLEADISRKKRKKTVDSLAAILILQNYLDYLKNQK